MRRLSNIEWATFLNDIDVASMKLPPWGTVIDWGGLAVLVYVAPSGEVWTTDISDEPQLLANIPRIWDDTQQVWYYQLPKALMETTVERGHDAGALIQATGDAVVRIAETAGKAAGGLTGPLLENLTVPLVLIGIGALFIFAKK